MIPFSTAAGNMRSSEIRRLMAMAADPSIISFSGGMPNNSLFPVSAVDEIWAKLPLERKQVAFQYAPTQGLPFLIETVKKYLATKGLPTQTHDLIITTGAQQAINLIAKVMLDPGDTVITEYPSFIGALAAFKSYGAELTGVALDADGIDLESLKRVYEAGGRKAKMLYINTHFQNPGGITYSPNRKQQLIQFLKSTDLLLLEDDPYNELFFDESDRALTVPIAAMDHGSVPVCYVGSFAKIFGPGMRLGWALAPKEIIEKCELAKQSMDACSSSFTQVLSHEFLAGNRLEGYVGPLRPIYKRRARLMLDALEKNAPKGVTWTNPKGGFFVWVTLPEHMNSSDVFGAAIKEGAAFVIGSAFDPEGKRNNCIRLAFSHTPEEKIGTGMEIVCRAIKQFM